MRKFAAAAVCVAELAGAAVAIARHDLAIGASEGHGDAKQGGDAQAPAGRKAHHDHDLAEARRHEAADRDQVLVWFPKGSLYNGGKVSSCSKSKIAKGPSTCPKASIMGSGSGTAYAGAAPQLTPRSPSSTAAPRRSTSTPSSTTQLGFVRQWSEPSAKSSGKYAYELSAPMPKELQVVAGDADRAHAPQGHRGQGRLARDYGLPRRSLAVQGDNRLHGRRQRFQERLIQRYVLGEVH